MWKPAISPILTTGTRCSRRGASPLPARFRPVSHRSKSRPSIVTPCNMCLRPTGAMRRRYVEDGALVATVPPMVFGWALAGLALPLARAAAARLSVRTRHLNACCNRREPVGGCAPGPSDPGRRRARKDRGGRCRHRHGRRRGCRATPCVRQNAVHELVFASKTALLSCAYSRWTLSNDVERV